MSNILRTSDIEWTSLFFTRLSKAQLKIFQSELVLDRAGVAPLSMSMFPSYCLSLTLCLSDNLCYLCCQPGLICSHRARASHQIRTDECLRKIKPEELIYITWILFVC